MIFAAIPWLNISISLLLVVFVIVCLLMSIIILMQRPKQEGLGAAFGGGVTDQVFGARTTNVLQKGTVYLGSLFFLLCLTLAILIGKQSKPKTLLDPEKAVAAEVSEMNVAEETPAAPETPATPASLADELPTEQPVETPAAEVPTEEAPATEAPTVEEIPATEPAAIDGVVPVPGPDAQGSGANKPE